jgi:hypothetical protein
VFVTQAESGHPQGIELGFDLLNDPSPLGGHVKRGRANGRQCSGFRFPDTLPIIQDNCPNMKLSRENDGLRLAGLKARRILKLAHLQAVLDFYHGDPIADGSFNFARSGLSFAIDDDFPVDGCWDCNRAQNGIEQRQVLQR